MIRVRERLFAAPHFGRSGGPRRCPLSGVKRTSQECTAMSAYDPKRTWWRHMRDVALSAPKRFTSPRLDDAKPSGCRFPGVSLQVAT
jgi:hypothetical protein